MYLHNLCYGQLLMPFYNICIHFSEVSIFYSYLTWPEPRKPTLHLAKTSTNLCVFCYHFLKTGCTDNGHIRIFYSSDISDLISTIYQLQPPFQVYDPLPESGPPFSISGVSHWILML